MRNDEKYKFSILILNADMTPLSITTIRKGFKLVWKGRAEILETDERPIHTENFDYERPNVIRLLEYVNVPYRRIKVSKINIFKRDKFKCVYCGSLKDLTLDHVIPRCKGGKNTWENLATCCYKCNRRKGNWTIEQARMTISYAPFYPSQYFYMKYMSSDFDQKWEKFFNI
jgi:5-methylcytosine-specific restriction endonuclease McrA